MKKAFDWGELSSGHFSKLSTDESQEQAWFGGRKIILSKMLIRLERPEVFEELNPRIENPIFRFASQETYSHAARTDESIEDHVLRKVKSPKEVIGHLEIQGGLAVLNTSHIEVRRIQDGVEQDLGNVNIKDGTYSIELSDRQGLLVGKLVDHKGRTWGEGQVRLENVFWNGLKKHQGPTLKIGPTFASKGQLQTPYTMASNDKNKVPAAGVKVHFTNGAIERDIPADGQFTMDELRKYSSTLARFESANFMPTQQIYTVGMNDKSLIMPKNMMGSLKSIVSEQKQYNLYDPEAPVIWGQVVQDGQNASGIRVEMEMHPEFEVIYFNDYFLPDSQLTATGKNGLFAIINPPEGYQSLVAFQGEKIFSYQNTVVDRGVASYVELQNTIKTKNTALKVFDAFSGLGVTTKVSMQSMDEEFLVKEQTTIRTQEISRWGLLKSENGDGYVNAHYLYNDSDEFIHVPLFQQPWIENIMLRNRINQSSQKAIFIGLVSEDDYHVDLMVEDQQSVQVVYFDAAGEVILSNKGKAGGGFIVFNAPPDVFEAVVSLNQNDDQVISRLVPGQPGDTLVSVFR